MDKIKIGTCVKGEKLLNELPGIIAAGFETVELYFTDLLGDFDFKETSKKAMEMIGDRGIKFSSIGFYCNPLQYEERKEELERCIENAHLFGADIVGTFAGAIAAKSVADTIPTFKKVFSELVKKAENVNVKIGIENAHMYGHWYMPTCNIGFCPRAWEMMFDAVDSLYLGLEWEPSHQLEQMIDPLEQLKTWSSKIVHVHGKDAKIDRAYINRYGIWFGEKYCTHRFPGLGECNWTEIMKILKNSGYSGDICIEGFHDPVFSGEREMEGQINALNYLKKCRERL